MKLFRPFFMLTMRASVVWVSLLAFAILAFVLSSLSQPVDMLALYVNAPFMAVIMFPGLVGLILGLVVQEFQHTTLALFLPRARMHILAGFILSGILVSLLTSALVVSYGPSLQAFVTLLAVGVAAYFLGSIIVDPLAGRLTPILVSVIALAVSIYSQWFAIYADQHPLQVISLSLLIVILSANRLFSIKTFRLKPFRATAGLPGRFAFQQSDLVKRQKRLEDGPVRSQWKAIHRPDSTWHWVRSALHETYGAHVFKSLVQSIKGSWGLAFIFVLGAWLDKGDMPFGKALAWSFNDALLRSPHIPEFSDHGGPYPLVMIVIALVGFSMAIWKPITLGDRLLYPLARSQHAQISFHGSLLDAAIMLFIVSPLLLLLGELAGLYAGFDIRFDFMPFFFRVMMITLVLMPLGYWGHLSLQEARRRKAENIMLMVGVGVTFAVILVSFLTVIFGRVFDSPGVELTIMMMLLLASRLVYWLFLVNYYSSADLE